MATDPKKLTIRDHMLAALEGITKGAGYHTDAGNNVSTRKESIAKVGRFPYLAIVVGAEAKVDIIMGRYRAAQEFIVTGYVKAVDTDDALMQLEADVKKAVLADPSRGGNAAITTFEEGTTDYQELASSGLGQMEQAFLVWYDWTPSAP